MTARKPDGVALTPDVPTLLAALGGTADEVAASLRAAGIRGWRNVSGSCPLAMVLRSHGFRHPYVGGYTVRGVPGTRALELPRPCQVFVYHFDLGAYPDLEVSP